MLIAHFFYFLRVACLNNGMAGFSQMGVVVILACVNIIGVFVELMFGLGYMEGRQEGKQKVPTCESEDFLRRGDRIRTCGRLVPNQERYRAALHPVMQDSILLLAFAVAKVTIFFESCKYYHYYFIMSSSLKIFVRA